MLKAIIFDFDGTLLDSDKMIVETFRQLYEMFKPTIKPDLEHFLSFSGPPIKESLKKEFPDIDQDFAFEQFQKLSEENYIKYVKPFPYVIDTLKELKKRNIKMALVTSKGRAATEFALKLTSLNNIFDFIICADEVKKVKPDPEGVLLALKYLNIENKNEAIYIGDSRYDYLTAKNAKLKFGYVTFSPRKLLDNEKADIYISSFKNFIEEVL